MTANTAGPQFWREAVAAYGFAFVMFAIAIIPGLNFTYSGHGGFSWLLIPLCFPYVVLRAAIKIVQGAEDRRKWYSGFYKVTIPCYVLRFHSLGLLQLPSVALSAYPLPLGVSLQLWSRQFHGGTSPDDRRKIAVTLQTP